MSDLADAVTRIVQSLRVQRGESRHIECDWENRELFPEENVAVRAWRPRLGGRCIWQSAEAGYVPECQREHVLAAIAKKEIRLPSYLRRAEEIWLVLVADAFSISGTFGMPDPGAIGVIETGFSRVYFFDNFARRTALLYSSRERLKG